MGYERRLQENMVSIGLMAGWMASRNLIEINDTFLFMDNVIRLAKEFEDAHPDIVDDYLGEIDEFAQEKLSELHGTESQGEESHIDAIDNMCKEFDLETYTQLQCKIADYEIMIGDLEGEVEDLKDHIAVIEDNTPNSVFDDAVDYDR